MKCFAASINQRFALTLLLIGWNIYAAGQIYGTIFVWLRTNRKINLPTTANKSQKQILLHIINVTASRPIHVYADTRYSGRIIFHRLINMYLLLKKHQMNANCYVINYKVCNKKLFEYFCFLIEVFMRYETFWIPCLDSKFFKNNLN